MAQFMNSTVDLTIRGVSYNGLYDYGNIMVGDAAFEFYNEKNVEDYIQIPWPYVDYVSAEVLFNKHIPRFAIFTTDGKHFTFSSNDNKELLRAMRPYVPADRLQKSPNFFQILGLGFKAVGNGIAGFFTRGLKK